MCSMSGCRGLHPELAAASTAHSILRQYRPRASPPPLLKPTLTADVANGTRFVEEEEAGEEQAQEGEEEGGTERWEENLASMIDALTAEASALKSGVGEQVEEREVDDEETEREQAAEVDDEEAGAEALVEEREQAAEVVGLEPPVAASVELAADSVEYTHPGYRDKH
jgi:hypothetical protein